MTRKYLYPRQRQIEVISAIYVGGLGVYVGMADAIGGKPPLGWLGLSHNGQLALAEVMVTIAVIWSLGIRINGNWAGSPFLRLGAMLANTAIALFAVWQGHASSASYTYGWVSGFLAVGAFNAAQDCYYAWRERVDWKLI